MGSLNTVLCGIPIDNPIIPASGTFGYGYEFAELYDINCLGSFSAGRQSPAQNCRISIRDAEFRRAAESRSGIRHLR